MAKRYQRTIKSRKSKEGQTTQWLKDNKGQSEAVNQRKASLSSLKRVQLFLFTPKVSSDDEGT
jgi:hypothetical protein